jgi:hypothetical protein
VTPASVRRWFPAFAVALLSSALSADAPAPLDRRIDLDLVDAGAEVTFASFASVVGGELDLAPALVERKLSMRLQNVRVRTALEAACESLGCSWKLESVDVAGAPAKLKIVVRVAGARTATRPPLAAKLEERLSLDLADAPMDTVLGTFAHILGAELDLDPGLAGGEATIRLTDVTVRAALDTVLGGGWIWRVDDRAETRRLVVRRR